MAHQLLPPVIGNRDNNQWRKQVGAMRDAGVLLNVTAMTDCKCLFLPCFNPFSLHLLNSQYISFFCVLNRGDKELHIPLFKVYRTTLGW